MRIEEYGDSLRVFYEKELEPVNIKTLPYPGFPTDLQQPMAVLLSSLYGDSIIEESIFESRFNYVDELRKMGADIEVNDRIAKIRGKGFLNGTSVNAPDLRAGAALIIAGLVAKGLTEINEIHHIDRGYENIENKFMNLGARIKRVE